MIIFGTRGVTYSAGSGDFYCPGCQAESSYTQKRVRRFFTLYFIPLIPLDLHGEYVECQHCRGKYSLEILDYDPATGAAEFKAEFHRAVTRVMVAMMLADGDIDAEEIQTLRRLYSQLTGSELSEAQLQSEIGAVRDQQQSVTRLLAPIASALNDNGREMVVKAAYLVAAADGRFEDEEKALIAQIGKVLGMTGAHLKGVITSMQDGPRLDAE